MTQPSSPDPTVPGRRPRIEIVEVGLRDGLQNDPTLLDTPTKLAFLQRLLGAGARRLEVASFVNPRRVPQMADSAELMAAAPRLAGVRYIGLALNAKGCERAIAAQCDEINYVICASDGFGVRNQGATTQESLAEMKAVYALSAAAKIPLSVTISVAFGCPFDGIVAPERVGAIAGQAASQGAIEIALGDTIGVADPWAVRDIIARITPEIGRIPLRMHFHNTRNTALANAFAAIEAGVRILDASCGGIGGCPFAPKATGNVASEDLVYMLERAGFETGLDLAGLIDTAQWLESAALMHPVPSMLAKAGGFP